MNEDAPTTNVPESREVHIEAVQDLQQASEAARRVQNIDQMAQTVSLAEKAKKVGDRATAVMTATGLAALGAGFANAAEAQAQHVQDQNQQWQQDAEQNLQQQQFEEGLDSGKVTIDIPASNEPAPLTPEDNTIPSPVVPNQDVKQMTPEPPQLASPETH